MTAVSWKEERSTSHQQNLQKSPKRRRVEQDHGNGKVSFYDPDNNTSILTHEEIFTHFPVFNFCYDDDTDSHSDSGPCRDLQRGRCSKLKGAHGAGDETMN